MAKIICPKCNNETSDDTSVCQMCGADLSEASFQTNTNKKVSKNNSNVKMTLLIITLVLLVGFGGIYFIITIKNKIQKNIDKLGNIASDVIDENIDTSKITDETNNNDDQNNTEEQHNTYEKLMMDYENDAIDINKLFEQLVYIAYDSSSVDEKYKSDYDFYVTFEELGIDDILEDNFEELDEEIVKFYLTNRYMLNVSIGVEGPDVVTSNVNVLPWLSSTTKDEEYLSKTYNHNLDHVYLSENENFLIWYTPTGDDAITDEQVNEIAYGLEKTKNIYEKEFNIEYLYNPYVDNKYSSKDYRKAEKALEIAGISTKHLKTAMSLYVYDTGSDSVLASYVDDSVLKRITSAITNINIIGEDAIINYPYIIINKRGIEDSVDNLEQIYNHELFHHFQFIYSEEMTGKTSVCGLIFSEGMANFSSSISSDTSTTDNFLNGWARVYKKNTSTKLVDIKKSEKSTAYGYAIFPYFYSYSEVVSDWSDVLMAAHIEEEPFTYIQDSTSTNDMKNVINDLAYRTLSQDYDNNCLKSNEQIIFGDFLFGEDKHSFFINPGAIDYYEISSACEVQVKNKNSDYVTMKIYGHKDGKYKEIISSSDTIEIDTAFYANYDEFYLAVTNGDLLDSYEYEIIIKDSEFEDNTEFVTGFDNYNIEIIMNTQIGDIYVDIVSTGVVDELHQKEYLEVETTTFGDITLSNKLYYDFNSGYTYMTQPYGGDVWWKEKGFSQSVDLKLFLDKLTSMEDVTKVDNNHYKVDMSSEELEGLMSSAEVDSSTVGGNTYVDVYTKNGYITRLEYDCSDLIPGYDMFTAVINISNYDNAGDVEIPQVVIDNSQEM